MTLKNIISVDQQILLQSYVDCFRTTEFPRNVLSINPSQVELLTAFMEENPDFASGLFKTPDAKEINTG